MKPFSNPRIFWDVEVNSLNFESDSIFIIERVFSRGDVDDIRTCRKFYPYELIQKVLLNCKYLPMLRLHLASAIIDRPITDFRCYTTRQLNPELLPY